MSKNLIARLAVAAVAIPVILWICYLGGGWLFGMLLVFGLIGMIEFTLNEKFSLGGGMFWTAIACYLATFWFVADMPLLGMQPSSWAIAGWDWPLQAMPLAVFFILTAMAFAVGKVPPNELFRRHSRLCWGVIYLSFLYPLVFKVGDGVAGLNGGDSLLFLFGLLWVGDTAAMFVGKAMGKHKLAPTVSPNKTVEGFIGGIIGSLVIGVIMYFWKFENLGLLHVVIIAAGCSVFGQIGDLVESMWKRSIGIKDSSAIIPGHGGVLDRFDSLLFGAPFMYVYLQLVG